MVRRACLALALCTLTPQVAFADCWLGNSAHAFKFLWSATVEDVEHCLHRGIGPNERDSEGVPPLFSMSVIGTNNPDGLAVIGALVRAGGDAHYAPRGWKKFVTALYRAEEEWGKDSDVARAMRGEAQQSQTAARAPSGSVWERTAVVYGWTGEHRTGRLSIFVTRGQRGDHDGALARAMSNCRASGRWECDMMGSYLGRCFSIAHGDDNTTGGGTEINELGIGTGDTLAVADRAALEDCRLRRNVGCKIWSTNMRKCSD